MTLILAFFAAHISWIIAAGAAIAAFFAGHAKATTAAQVKVDAAHQQVAAAQHTLATTLTRVQADKTAAATPDDQLDAQLKAIGALRNE